MSMNIIYVEGSFCIVNENFWTLERGEGGSWEIMYGVILTEPKSIEKIYMNYYSIKWLGIYYNY